MSHHSLGCSCAFLKAHYRVSSTIIDAISTHTTLRPGTAIAYFYFDFNDAEKQHVKGFLSTLIAQLALFSSEAAGKLQDLYTRCQNGHQHPSMPSLQNCFKEILELGSPTLLVFDALDECTQREKLLDLITEIQQWKMPNVNVLATSRKEQDITEALMPLLTGVVDIQSTEVESDIRLYVENCLQSDAKLKRWCKDADLKDEIQKTLIDGADGMYNAPSIILHFSFTESR
jgi:hypothetical protein